MKKVQTNFAVNLSSKTKNRSKESSVLIVYATVNKLLTLFLGRWSSAKSGRQRHQKC